MKLHIHHETIYQYSRRVRFGPHRLVVRPREGHDLRVESMVVTVSPEAKLTWSRDVFGNSIATLDFPDVAAKQLKIVTDVHVARTLPFPLQKREVSCPTPWPPAYDPLEITVVAAYQQLSYPHDAAAVGRWFRENCSQRPEHVEDLIKLATRTICEKFKYSRREEKGVLTPAQLIVGGAGSCRDFATLLLEIARSQGIAARFASGYLECTASEAGYASTHAWAEIYLPGQGWCGFDPTIGKETDHRHVATGLSNHPRGVMPVTGSYYGPAAAFKLMNVSVLLREADQPAEAAASILAAAARDGAAVYSAS